MPYEGAVWRFCSVEYDPHDGTGAWEHGGRFNLPGAYAVYLCSSLACVYAEHHRHLDNARREARNQGIAVPIPALDVHEGQVLLFRVLDMTSLETSESLGISRQDLIASDNRRCQRLGEEACGAGFEAILSRSAAQDIESFEERDRTLVVFPERLVGRFAFEKVVERWPAMVVH